MIQYSGSTFCKLVTRTAPFALLRYKFIHNRDTSDKGLHVCIGAGTYLNRQ